MILTTKGEMDESALQLRTDVTDNDNEFTTSKEYCEVGCKGEAHSTGIADGPGLFCKHHIRRDVDMHLKKGLDALMEQGSFG